MIKQTFSMIEKTGCVQSDVARDRQKVHFDGNDVTLNSGTAAR
jgi:hypothetical protein